MEFIAFLFLHPPITGFYAKSKGHNFWLWFFMGLVLPIISNVILYFIKEKPITINPDDLVVNINNDKVLYKRA